MSREWQPGDMARTGLGGTVARTCGGHWVLLDDGHRINLDHEPRPLVVIDPEDREQVKRLLSAFTDAWGGCAGGAEPALQAALREFANPTPPKPEEPGKYGVVVAGDGREWTRYTTSEQQGRDWVRPDAGGGTVYARWDDLDVIRVVREGVIA